MEAGAYYHGLCSRHTPDTKTPRCYLGRGRPPTKSAHFLPLRTSYDAEQLAELYIKKSVRLHGVPLSIVSDRDTKFASRFWHGFQTAMGTELNLSTTFHPQTDGQSERTIQTLEDMLRAYALDYACLLYTSDAADE